MSAKNLSGQFDRWLNLRVQEQLGDAQLLERFRLHRDETAFAALVGRHGPMVRAVCGRLLADPHDQDDAFQATFLVLVRKAKSIRKRASVAAWLHGVARRVSLQARSQSSRRPLSQTETVEAAAATYPSTNDDKEWLDREIAGLPDRYRLPVVLCCLEGRTLDQAALHLGWPKGSVAGRLSRAKDLLRSRLARRGLGVAAIAALEAAALAEAAAEVPAPLATATVAAGQALLHGAETVAASAAALLLSKGMVKAMFWTKISYAALAVALIGGLGWSASALGSFRGVPTSSTAQAKLASTPSKGNRLEADEIAYTFSADWGMSVPKVGDFVTLELWQGEDVSRFPRLEVLGVKSPPAELPLGAVVLHGLTVRVKRTQLNAIITASNGKTPKVKIEDKPKRAPSQEALTDATAWWLLFEKGAQRQAVREDGKATFALTPSGRLQFDVAYVRSFHMVPPEHMPIQGALSPDGKQLAFIGKLVDGKAKAHPWHGHVILSKPDGSEPKVITEKEGTRRELSWSPDGKRLAFEEDTDKRLAVPNKVKDWPGGTDGLRRVVVLDVASGKTLFTFGGETESIHSPQFTPRGRLAYLVLRGRDGKVTLDDLVVRILDGTMSAEALKPQTLVNSQFIVGYAFSPDESQVAYSLGQEMIIKKLEQADVRIYSVKGLNERHKTNWGVCFLAPVWRPDGQMLACRTAFLGGRAAGPDGKFVDAPIPGEDQVVLFGSCDTLTECEPLSITVEPKWGLVGWAKHDAALKLKP